MRRREFITLLSGVAVGWPLAARAERPPFVVGMIGNSPYWPHFREAMRDLGYREGQNVKYELRTDEIEPARLAEAAKELASIPVNYSDCNGLGGRSCSRRIDRKPRTSRWKRNWALGSRPGSRSQAAAIIATSYPIPRASGLIIQSEQCLQHNHARRNRNRNARSRYEPCSGRGQHGI